MWFYKGQVVRELSQFPEGTYGFIYKITRVEDGKFYVGKKNLLSERTKLLTKKELAELPAKGRKPTKKKVITESNWKDYYGSEPSLKESISELGRYAFKREILHLCSHKKQLTYQEMRHQILEGCLESENCFNGNVLGKFWRKDI